MDNEYRWYSSSHNNSIYIDRDYYDKLVASAQPKQPSDDWKMGLMQGTLEMLAAQLINHVDISHRVEMINTIKSVLCKVNGPETLKGVGT